MSAASAVTKASAVSTSSVCGNCGELEATAQKLHKCGRCKIVFYCSIDCQVSDLSSHKITCTSQRASSAPAASSASAGSAAAEPTANDDSEAVWQKIDGMVASGKLNPEFVNMMQAHKTLYDAMQNGSVAEKQRAAKASQKATTAYFATPKKLIMEDPKALHYIVITSAIARAMLQSK